MSVDFDSLLTTIRRVFPLSRLEPLAEPELATIRSRHLGVPEHYFAFLREVGWGSLSGSTLMIYIGLCEPTEIFDPETAASLDGCLLFGDDFSGWMVGFDTRDR